MIASNQTYPETTLLKSYSNTVFGNLLDYNKGGYEGIKSVGLNMIKNDSLRKELIFLYELRLSDIKSLYEYLINKWYSKDYTLQLNNALWKRDLLQKPNNSYKIVDRPITMNNF